MTKAPEEMLHQTTRRAVEATNFGMNWWREMAEQQAGQTKVAVEGFMNATRKAIDGFNRQGSVVHQHSLSLV
jgi:hypothetical protein